MKNSKENIKNMVIKKAINLHNIDGRVDIVKLANDLGIRVFSAENMKSSSMIYYIKDTDSFEILINDNESTNRKRFSVAHEIAHFILHQDKIKQLGSVGRQNNQSLSSEEEKEADTLGAEILMPHSCVLNTLKKNNVKQTDIIHIDIVKKIADEFEVSIIAACMRLRELGYYVGYISI